MFKRLALFSTLFLSGVSLAIEAPQSYTVPQDDLVYMQTSEGLIIYQVLPQVSPNHAARFKALAKEGWYENTEFYRVIDGFVAQAGDGGWPDENGKPGKNKTELKAELTRAMSKSFFVAQSPALLAPETGYIASVPAGRDKATNEEWLLHCPGTVAMARSNDLHSGTTEFYIAIGQAPRHLDRNMSVFARVVQGMEVAQRMTRGDLSQGGVIPDTSRRAKILWAKLGTDIDASMQKTVTVDTVESTRFQTKLAGAKKKSGPFFVYPGTGNIDVCYNYPKVEVK